MSMSLGRKSHGDTEVLTRPRGATQVKEVREKLQSITDGLGQNARNHTVHFIEVNTMTKTINGHKHASRGLPEFVSTLLTNLDPIDALTFTRRTFLFTPRLLVSESKKQMVRNARQACGKRTREQQQQEEKQNKAAPPPATVAPIVEEYETRGKAPSSAGRGTSPATRRQRKA